MNHGLPPRTGRSQSRGIRPPAAAAAPTVRPRRAGRPGRRGRRRAPRQRARRLGPAPRGAPERQMAMASRRPRRRVTRRWSRHVTEHSNALDLEHRVFSGTDPARIAHSLKRSAERSRRRKKRPVPVGAVAKLTFYINRVGKKLRKRQLTVPAAGQGGIAQPIHTRLARDASVLLSEAFTSSPTNR